jgi:uncharacterized protein YodC (DUF2158 family)
MGVQDLANAFNKGDVVVLKSGGMPMTVALCPGDPHPNNNKIEMTEYGCFWHRGAKPEEKVYPEHVLEPYDLKKKA